MLPHRGICTGLTCFVFSVSFLGGCSTLMHEDVREEREAILAAVREERIAVTAAIAEERRIVLEALHEERTAAFANIDTLMDRAFTREVNKVFIRALFLIGIILAGFAAITFLGVRALNRRSS